MNKNIKLFFNYFLVPVLFIWLTFNLYSEINHQKDKVDAWQQIKDAFTGSAAWQIYLAVALMFVNWGIEALKWQWLIKPLQHISFITAYKAIFAGTSFAANTPNRVGEYFGRMIYIEEGKRLQSIPLTVAGSFSQLIVTLLAGGIGLFFYTDIIANTDNPTISPFWLKIILSGTVAVAVLCVLIYFKLGWLTAVLIKIPFLQKYEFFFRKVDELSNQLLGKILLLSMLRYGVFLLQYILVLNAFGVTVNLFTTSCLLTVLFLLMSIIPSFILIEAGIRGKVSIELFRTVTTNFSAVMAAGLFIWAINLMIPAIFGVLLLLGKKVFKK